MPGKPTIELLILASSPDSTVSQWPQTNSSSCIWSYYYRESIVRESLPSIQWSYSKFLKQWWSVFLVLIAVSACNLHHCLYVQGNTTSFPKKMKSWFRRPKNNTWSNRLLNHESSEVPYLAVWYYWVSWAGCMKLCFPSFPIWVRDTCFCMRCLYLMQNVVALILQ